MKCFSQRPRQSIIAAIIRDRKTGADFVLLKVFENLTLTIREMIEFANENQKENRINESSNSLVISL